VKEEQEGDDGNEDEAESGPESADASDDESGSDGSSGDSEGSEDDGDPMEDDDEESREDVPVKPSLPEPAAGTTLFVRNVPFDATEEEMRTL